MRTHGDHATSGASVSLPGLCMERGDYRRECARPSLYRLITDNICVDFFMVSSTLGVLMTGVRHSIKSQVFGLLASLSELPLVIFVQILLCTACLVGCLLFEHMVENFRQFMGRGRGGFGWPQLAAQAAIKRPERAGARAETLRGHAQGTTGPVLDPPTARGAHFAATALIVRTAAQPGGKMLVCGPFMHIEADLCEDDMDREGWSPRHLREIDTGDPGEMGPQIKGRCVALGLPMGGRGWG